MKTKTGFTFVELIISMVILFLAVMVIGSIFPASFKSLLKSKQVTIATTLAQQKLEQCLINPKDYRTRVGVEGNFAPDHPEYGYSILEKQVTDKLKEIKVEVYKLVNGSKIIDAATAQLVQGEFSPMVWKVYSDNISLPSGPSITALSKDINIPQDGIIKIDAKGLFFNSAYRATNFNMYLYCDEQLIPDASNGGGTSADHRTTFGSTTTVINITPNRHTIQLRVSGSEPSSSLQSSLMIITYYPGIQLQP